MDDPLSIFSKYTPENPDVHAAQRIAIRPRVLFWFSVLVSLEVLPDVWTIATPIVRSTSENHFVGENLRWSIVALKRAVVKIFNW